MEIFSGLRIWISMDPHYFGKPDPFPHQSKKLDPSRIRIQVKLQALQRAKKLSQSGPWTLTLEAWRLKMGPQRLCRSVVADLHHFDEEQNRIRIRIKVKSRIRIRINVMRIHNPVF
jgi:hypothetical protein